MTGALASVVVGVVGVALGLGGAHLVGRFFRRKPKAPPGLPYLTMDEIKEADDKLRMLIGEDPSQPRPEKKRPPRPRMQRSDSE